MDVIASSLGADVDAVSTRRRRKSGSHKIWSNPLTGVGGRAGLRQPGFEGRDDSGGAAEFGGSWGSEEEWLFTPSSAIMHHGATTHVEGVHRESVATGLLG